MKIVNDTFNCGIRIVVAQPEGVCSQMVELILFGDEIQDEIGKVLHAPISWHSF